MWQNFDVNKEIHSINPLTSPPLSSEATDMALHLTFRKGKVLEVLIGSSTISEPMYQILRFSEPPYTVQ